MARKPIVRDITEEEKWQPYDPGNTKGVWEWAMNNAWDDWRNMDSRTCDDLVGDLVDAALPKAERKKITPEHLDALCRELMDENPEYLVSIHRAITDASQWAWEVAYTPDDGDIEDALEEARDRLEEEISLASYWDLVQGMLKKGPKEWTPRPSWTLETIAKDLASRVRYRRKKNEYNRYIVFDWLSAPPVVDMRMALRGLPNEGHPEDVDAEVEDWADRFMRVFFTRLEKTMQDVDTHNRVDFGDQWKFMLKDRTVLNEVAEALREFLKKPLPEEE